MNYAMNFITPAGKLSIPVLPETIQVKSPGQNETETVLGLGEVVLPRPLGLRTLSWESFFPANPAPYLTMSQRAALALPPFELVKAIQAIRDSLKPTKFQLLRQGMDLNMEVLISSFDYEERGGEPGDLYYSIELTEWRSFQAGALDLNALTGTGQEGENPRPGAPDSSKTYTVRKGDSLWAIAKRNYGSGTKWRTIYDANKSVVGSNPNLIYPGQVLTLP